MARSVNKVTLIGNLGNDPNEGRHRAPGCELEHCNDRFLARP